MSQANEIKSCDAIRMEKHPKLGPLRIHTNNNIRLILLMISSACLVNVSCLAPSFKKCGKLRIEQHRRQQQTSFLTMVMSTPDVKQYSSTSSSLSSSNRPNNNNNNNNSNKDSASTSESKSRKRRKYKRKRGKTPTELQRDDLRKSRQAEYEMIRKEADGKAPPIWAFESLFPEPMWDDDAIYRDLFEISDREKKEKADRTKKQSATINQETKILPLSSSSDNALPAKTETATDTIRKIIYGSNNLQSNPVTPEVYTQAMARNKTKVDRAMTRMVEDRMYGFRRSSTSDFQYDTSLMDDGAVKFRDGRRLGRALKVNIDKLSYYARKELNRNRLEEAEELFEKAMEMDKRDGRPYLGLSRIAQKRRDFKYAGECLRAGIANSINPPLVSPDGFEIYDNGANPFLLQALGCLEERMGHLSEAENLFIEATKSRPSHAAAWVSLARLRTRKLRQGVHAGRICYQNAETELRRVGMSPSAHVYTSWASLECDAGDKRRARELFEAALKIDAKCSVAWLQLGVMESNNEDWARAKECFETVLKFDQRNSKVLQAYAIMESKRPDGESRVAIDLFERALSMRPRDAGVYQAYALYVAELGDIDGARTLLQKGTEVDKRHAPVWQAWGVLETKYGTAEKARDLFQQGIWACAQSSGGQSGGRRCARLWQAWGVLEAREGDHAAARRCFSRALDADSRNVAAITAWTLMEEELEKFSDARLIFEGALKQFTSPSDEKMNLWRAYEVMEAKAGNIQAAQSVYQRSIRDSIVRDELYDHASKTKESTPVSPNKDKEKEKSNEVEVSRWASKSANVFGGGEVWMNDGSIEAKVPSPKRNTKK